MGSEETKSYCQLHSPDRLLTRVERSPINNGLTRPDYLLNNRLGNKQSTVNIAGA